jgi:AcrR family transcriptional regulator
MGLREDRRTRTRQAIQEHAMRLFAERGFDATTVADVAAAAEVSSMTVFRHFPTKEDLVLTDDEDPVILDWILAQPADRPMITRIAAALLESTAAQRPEQRAILLARLRIGLSVPALRSRIWDGQYQTQRFLVDALASEHVDEFEVWVAASACIAAATVAIVRWAERGGTDDLTDTMAAALRVVTPPPDRSSS